MADVTATERTREQGRRLRALREARNLKKPTLASRLGFGSTQTLDLYERGVSIIRLDRVGAWAEAFDMDPMDFVNAVLSDPAPYSLESELREAGVPEWAVQRTLQAAHGEPLLIQQWIAAKVREMAASGDLPENESPATDALPLAFLRHA